jgi:hypothetical protein
LTQHLGRRLTRRIVRCSRPRYLAETIRCYKRALRARRRLMKLAPRLFDPALVVHEQRQHELDLKWQAESKAAIEKVYGEPCVWPDPWWESRTQIASDKAREFIVEFETLNLYMHQAAEFYRLYRELQPHDIANINQICDLIEMASRFGRIAVGLETARKEPLPPLNDHSRFQADLECIYGDRPA